MIAESCKDEEAILIAIIDEKAEDEGIVNRMFADFWAKNITNVYVMTSNNASGSDVVRLHTFFPFKEGSCGRVNPVIVNEYRNGRFTSNLQIFVDKLRSMHQCPLVLAVRHMAPVVKVERSIDGDVYIRGRNGPIIYYVASALNFSIAVYNFTGIDMRSALLKLV